MYSKNEQESNLIIHPTHTDISHVPKYTVKQEMQCLTIKSKPLP